jgi:hypothetical protein
MLKTFGHNIKLRIPVLRFDKESGPEASPSWFREDGRFKAFAPASYKTDSDSNEESGLIKHAMPYATVFVLGI